MLTGSWLLRVTERQRLEINNESAPLRHQRLDALDVMKVQISHIFMKMVRSLRILLEDAKIPPGLCSFDEKKNI
jgi:hypothetical protein